MIAIRTEFYGRFQNAIRQQEGDTLFIADYLLEELDENNLIKAIQKPTSLENFEIYGSPKERYRFSFEKDLPEIIANTLKRESPSGGILPVMQIKTSNRPHTIRIFTFGNTCVGKSTFHAILIESFRKRDDTLIVFEDVESKKIILEWMENIENKQFPKFTQRGREIKFSLIGVENNIRIIFTLFEMPGESMQKIDWKLGGMFSGETLEALKKSDIILTLIPINEIRRQELLIEQFLNFLYSNKIKKPLALIFNKWDLKNFDTKKPIFRDNKSNNDLLGEVVDNNLKNCIKFLQVEGIFENPAIFYFSIGSVKEEGGIERFDPKGLEEITEWLVENSKKK